MSFRLKQQKLFQPKRHEHGTTQVFIKKTREDIPFHLR